jgi:peptide/nickel transport system substrate-binding protein
VVRLRNGLAFHDGTPLTLDDVKFTYETLLAQVDSPWHELVKGSISEVRIVNRTDLTIAFGLRPDQDGLYPLALPAQLFTIGIVPQAVYSAGPAQFGQRPVGCGPFQLVEFSPGQALRLEAFGLYGQGKPRLDGIEIEIEPDKEGLIEMLRAQRVRAVVLPYTQTLADQLGAAGLLVQPRPEGAPPDLLHVASSKIYERFPNAYDTNWNAHLWYV